MSMQENHVFDRARSRCFAEISESALRHNIRAIKTFLPETSSWLGVVKADAYGHGAVRTAEICLEMGAAYLAVAMPEEAFHLREGGIKAPILILSHSAPEYTEDLVRLDITQSVSSFAEAEGYSRAAAGLAHPLKIHIKLDTGMARLGYSAREKDQAETIAEIKRSTALPNLDAEGIFTHFATAGNPDTSYRDLQFARYMVVVKGLEAEGITFRIRHCANSATILREPSMALDMVRAGIILYGGRDGDFMKEVIRLRPVMRFCARISTIRELEAGETVSYGRIFTAGKSMRIAVVEAGYADGLPRILSNKAIFSLRGQEVPQIGRICMDRCMIDISHIPDAQIGDIVTLWGEDGRCVIDPEEQAERAGTISYELFCDVAARVPRIYVTDKE